MNDSASYEAATLDPPGSIVVLGTTALGIEAALYGRFLGYDVRLLAGRDMWHSRDFVSDELQRIGPTLQDDWMSRHWLNGRDLSEAWDDTMPMMPDRCMSSLAFSALGAQREDVPFVLPDNFRQWIADGLYELTQTDLLRGRVFSNTFVESISLVPVEPDADDEDLPPDFELHLSGETDEWVSEPTLRCECLIIADLPADSLPITSDSPIDYLFPIGCDCGRTNDAESSNATDWLKSGFREITELYAGLADRENLDLYRPSRI